MHYVPDTKGIRDAREKIAEIREDAEIANLEKKKDLIQDEIDALEEQKDLIRDMIEESNEYYDNLIKQTEKSIKELSKNAEEASKAAGNAAGSVGGAINKLRNALDTGKTLSYYIWTVQDEEVLANAKAGLENLNTLLEKNPENTHYAQLKDDVTNFVAELEKLKETRLVTDDFTNSLNTLKNSEDEYLRLFQDALAGVEERVNNTANYSEKILGFVSPIADKTGELKQTLEKANEDVTNLGSNTSDVVNGISASVDGTQENINRLTGSVADAVMKVSNDSELLSGSVGGISDAVMRVTESTSDSFADFEQKISNVKSSLDELSSDILNYQMPPVDTNNFAASFDTPLTALRGFVDRFKEICDEIPDIWNATLSEAFGTGGNDGEAIEGGLGNTSKYEELFTPIVEALEECKINLESQLKECLDIFTEFQTDLSGIIGVGGGSDKSEKGQSGSGESGGSNKGSGNKEKSGSGGDTIVGAIQEGGALIEEALNGEEDSWAASFVTAQNSIHETATSIVECIESMVQEIVNACIAAIEAINMLEQAQGGEGNHPTPPPYGRSGHSHGESGSAFADGTVGKAFAKGYNGLPRDEKNALRSEYGQPELTLYPDGRTELTNQPVMSDLPKGTIIFNEEQTKRILNGEPYMKGRAFADGSIEFDNGSIYTSEGKVITPLRPGDKMYDMIQKFSAYMESIDNNLEKLVPNSMYEHGQQMNEIANQITNSSIINNRNIQPVIHQNVTLNCPNVTNNSGVEYIQKELGHLSLMARQEPLKRY